MLTLLQLAKRQESLLAEAEIVQAQIKRSAVDAIKLGAPKYYVARDAGVSIDKLKEWVRLEATGL